MFSLNGIDILLEKLAIRKMFGITPTEATEYDKVKTNFLAIRLV